MAILNDNIALRRRDGLEGARQGVMSDRGKIAMDAIRALVAEMQGEERSLLAARIAEMDNAYRVAVASSILTTLLGMILSFFAVNLLRRVALARQRQDWLLSGQTGLSAVMIGDQRLEQLGEVVLGYLAQYLDAQVGVLFAKESGGFRRIAAYGLPAGGSPEWVAEDESLLGQSAKDGKPHFVRDVPAGHLTFGSGLSRGQVGQLLIVPVRSDGVTNGVIELGFVNPIEEPVTELFARTADAVGTAIRSAHYRASLQNLLEETQRQAEELQVQSEELRVSNEELEEQSRALKESQARLELQQAELEQTNSQLEEQTQALESERDQLGRTKGELEQQARELERASQYKSDFLANMSHELGPRSTRP